MACILPWSNHVGLSIDRHKHDLIGYMNSMVLICFTHLINELHSIVDELISLFIISYCGLSN